MTRRRHHRHRTRRRARAGGGRKTAGAWRRSPALRRVARWLGWGLLSACGLLLLSILLLRVVDPPFWSWQLHRYLNPPAGYPAQRSQHWVALERIPRSLQLAVIAAEDQRFPEHGGIDTGAIQSALNEALDGEGLRGASTLTQQTVKNLYLWPGRDWLRKGLELPLALLVEPLWGKPRILELYLNVAEFGPGVYGVQAAARHWYGVDVWALTPGQAARLAAILPNPWRYRAEPPSPYVQRRSEWILRQMRQLGDGWLQRVYEN